MKNYQMKKQFKMKMYRLFVMLISGLVLIVSCGKPTDPETLKKEDVSGGYKIVTSYTTAGYAQDVVIKDHLAYIAQGEVGLMIVNVSEPENPQTVSITSDGVRGYSSKIDMKDSVVYIAAGSFGVTVLNVADPTAPFVTIANTSMKPAKGLHIMGDYLYTAISEQGVKIADISYPTQPDPRGVTSTSGYATSVSVTADTNFMLVACGEMGLSIYNISDFQEGYGEYPLVSLTITSGYAEHVTILDSKSLAYIACGTSGLQIIDFSDTTNVHVVGSYDSPGYAKELIYKDEKIFMTAEQGGLQIFDVADATNPKLIGLVEMEYALGIDIDDNYIYVADDEDGLIIVSIP